MKKCIALIVTWLCLFIEIFASFDNDLTSSLYQDTSRKNHYIGRIVIDDMKNGISESTWLYVNAALSYYKRTKPSCIILELNTPGGQVFPAQKISDALKNFDAQFKIPVIAYINNWAISAGAMLAFSCRFIVIAKDASMGAAEPIMMNAEGGGMSTASEKVNSALRADFANRAHYFGRNPDLAEAMVDKDIILVYRNGSIVKLDAEDQIHTTGKHPDVIISQKGKLLTLRAEELMKYGIADQMIMPEQLPALTEQEEKTQIYPLEKSRLHQIAALQQLKSCILDTFHMDWQTRFLSFLSTPYVTSILFFAMIVGLYIEISTPTFGVAGVISLASFFFIVLSSFAMEAIHWLEPILLVFGLGLVLLELFVFPTLGILAVLGGIFIIGGLAGIMLPGIESVSFSGDTLNAAAEYVFFRLSWISVSFLLAGLFILILSRYMAPRVQLMKHIVLQDSSYDSKKLYPTDIHKGELAIVVAPLRPAGKIVAHDITYDAISSGSFIEKGQVVRVIEIEGPKVVVDSI